MTNKSVKLTILIGLLTAPPIILFLIRQCFEISYIVSSFYKIIFLLPVFYRLFIDKKTFKKSILEGFSFNEFKKRWVRIIGIGFLFGGIYFFSYLLLQRYFRLESIATELNKLASINVTNIILIGIYIIIFNSLLEEFFWRGFVFKELLGVIKPWMAHAFTGIAFSSYHAMFYYNWFGFRFFILMTVSLIIFTILMNLIFQKYKDLLSCWFVHMFVDIAQIFIALKIFNMI